MAWRPYENLIDGELSNRVPGKVTGWIRFFRNNREPLRVELDLEGDFHQDIYGRMIRLSNPEPSDRAKDGSEGTYVEGFAPLQRGTAGDITAGFCLGTWSPEIAERLMARNESAWDDMGISGVEREVRRQDVLGQYTQLIEGEKPYYAYGAYPYIEWYSEANGRVVLELDNSQLVYCPESSRRYFGRLFADSFVALPRKTPGIPASRASLTTKIHPELTPRTSRTAH